MDQPLRHNKLAAAISLALAASAGGVQAQTANDSSDDRIVEEVTVTGKFRQSLIDSIGTKRDAASIVEAISAEDIGKLPDSSIAEAISRLPGLAGQRLDGRTSSIAIRGLGEDFSTATLNGREQVTISDNRGIEFDLYPSEIMSGVTVHKTPTAALTTQGIGGTIDLHTVKPLDADPTLHLNFNVEKNSFDKLNPDGEDQGWRGTLSWIEQFADDKVGVAVALATMDSPNQEERWNSWGFPTDGNNDLILGGAKPFVRSSNLQRNTVMGIVEFEPRDNLSITADLLFIDFEDEKILRGIEIPGAWAGDTVATSASNGLVSAGVINNSTPQVRNDFETREATMLSGGINLEYDINDAWNMKFDVSHGEIDRDIISLESYAGTGRPTNTGRPTDTISFVMGGGNQGALFTPTLDYGDDSLIMLGGAQGWGNGSTVPNDAQDGFINFPHVDDKLNTLKLSFNGDLGGSFFTETELGLYFADREKAKWDRGTFLTLPSYPGTTPIPAQYRLPNVSLGFLGIGDMIAYDSLAFYNDGNYNETSENLTVSNRALNTWVVNEKVTSVYGMANFETAMGEMPVSGNFGVQVVSTDQSSDGFAVGVENGFVVAQPTSGGDTYTEVLPSANVSLAISDEQQLRLGVARTMSRSRMDRMNASFGFSFDPAFNSANATIASSPWSGNGANPGLKPQMADQIDISYEYYFSDDGYVAGAYFFKDLKDWQVNVGQVVDFTGISPPGGQVALFNQGIVSRWENSSGGEVSGFELQGAVPFGLMHESLDGFGAVLSATFLDSKLNIDGNEIKVPGLSETIYNLTFYFEKAGWEARVSGSIRDEFLGEVSAISFSRELVTVKDTEIWDAQLSYSFAENPNEVLRGLSIVFQAQNLTNEPFVTFNNDDERQVRDFQDYGKNYLLGASYSFR